jgi:hypothetical protein
MNNQNNQVRNRLESCLGKRVSDSYWYKVKKWMLSNNCLNPDGASLYLKRFAVPTSQIENTNKWLDKAPDKIKFDDFLPIVEKLFVIIWAKKPGRTTLYSWFNSVDLGERFVNGKCRKHFTYTKTELIQVVNKVLSSRLIHSYK